MNNNKIKDLVKKAIIEVIQERNLNVPAMNQPKLSHDVQLFVNARRGVKEAINIGDYPDFIDPEKKSNIEDEQDFVENIPMKTQEEYYSLGYNVAKNEYKTGYDRARSAKNKTMSTNAYRLGYKAGLNQNYKDGYNDMYYHSLNPQRQDSKSYSNGYNKGYQDAWHVGYTHGLNGHASQSYNRAYLDGYNCGMLERNN